MTAISFKEKQKLQTLSIISKHFELNMNNYKEGQIAQIEVGENCYQTVNLTKEDIENPELKIKPIPFDLNAAKSQGMTIIELSGKVIEAHKTIYPKPPAMCVSIIMFNYSENKWSYKGKEIKYLHEAMEEISNYQNK